MPRNPRLDAPGSWHHVMNRGIARRTVFETRADVRFFLSRVAKAVRRGEIEVHAYCVMATHFHLLVRSPNESLSTAMQRIQNEYVRYFNRLRRRDGALFRGRFVSKLVDSLKYRQVLVRYIDDNPVAARIVPAAPVFPHGSARAYASPTGPPWLERSWVEDTVSAATGDPYDAHGYATVFGGPLTGGLRNFVELRIASTSIGRDPLDDLLAATPREVLSWMKRKARLADGTSTGIPVCDPASVAEAVARARATWGPWAARPRKRSIDVWPQVHANLLIDLCAATGAQAALRIGCSESSVRDLRARHREALREDRLYGDRVGQIATDALGVTCGTEPGQKQHDAPQPPPAAAAAGGG